MGVRGCESVHLMELGCLGPGGGRVSVLQDGEAVPWVGSGDGCTPRPYERLTMVHFMSILQVEKKINVLYYINATPQSEQK